jgi:uncharacterized protein (DUF1810 family)
LEAACVTTLGLMMRHKGKSALEILGSPDDLKFRPCLTLFPQAALGNSDREVFAIRERLLEKPS